MQDVKNDTVRNSLWLNGLSAMFLMIILLFVPPVTAVHAAEESQWTYDEGSCLWFYTDQNGWKYAMSSKDADSYELWSIAKKLKNITIKAENLTSKKLSKNIWKDTAKKMVVKVPAKKVNTYKKIVEEIWKQYNCCEKNLGSLVFKPLLCRVVKCITLQSVL